MSTKVPSMTQLTRMPPMPGMATEAAMLGPMTIHCFRPGSRLSHASLIATHPATTAFATCSQALLMSSMSCPLCSLT
ncbi:MAG: hypothetical protein QXT42_00900 [Thermoplasmata archaeon]